jgi:hypothetical protein
MENHPEWPMLTINVENLFQVDPSKQFRITSNPPKAPVHDWKKSQMSNNVQPNIRVLTS